MKIALFYVLCLASSGVVSAAPFLGGIINAGVCLLHNAKCKVFFTGAAAFCTAQKIVSQADCDNEYNATADLCNQNKELCGW